ncbi:MAG: hypothetical protein KBD00_02225 [Candidatus Peribacteraceae bacterium]|nr:hypothetical protein [Candidatus Peribacteraceae bacterium]
MSVLLSEPKNVAIQSKLEIKSSLFNEVSLYLEQSGFSNKGAQVESRRHPRVAFKHNTLPIRILVSDTEGDESFVFASLECKGKELCGLRISRDQIVSSLDSLLEWKLKLKISELANSKAKEIDKLMRRNAKN